MICAFLKLCEYFFKNEIELDVIVYEIEDKQSQFLNLPFKEINCSDQYIPIFDINNNLNSTWTKPWIYECLEDIPFTKSLYVNYEQILYNLDISEIKSINNNNPNDDLNLDNTSLNENKNFYNNKNNLAINDIDYSLNSILDELNN